MQSVPCKGAGLKDLHFTSPHGHALSMTSAYTARNSKTMMISFLKENNIIIFNVLTQDYIRNEKVFVYTKVFVYEDFCIKIIFKLSLISTMTKS